MKEWTDAVNYNPITGAFSNKLGRPVGWVSNRGYTMLYINGKQVCAHRVAFLLHSGYLPIQVDHINGKRTDNRAVNLRAATNTTNQRNKHKKAGKSPHLPIGIYECIRKGRSGLWYLAAIESEGVRFTTYKRNLKDAIEWREEKKRLLAW